MKIQDIGFRKPKIKNNTNGYVLATGVEDPAWLLGYTNLSVISWGGWEMTNTGPINRFP